MPEGASGLCSIAKNNDIEADVPPARKSRVPMCMFSLINKFASEMHSLNILHCCVLGRKIRTGFILKNKGRMDTNFWG